MAKTTKLRHEPTCSTFEMGASDMDGTIVEEIGFQTHLPSGTVCIVKLSDFEKVFIDMEMANAIADAINADRAAKVAS